MKYYIQIPLDPDTTVERLIDKYDMTFREAMNLVESMSDVDLILDDQRVTGYSRRV